MALGAGAKLGHYEIVASLGAGGMGEVYRAHDGRLGRDVALKILPAIFARDEDRLRRFSQEARAVAALNHPNILAIYDVGSEEGTPYLICEFLKGETLREKLDSGALPTRRALDYARQTATGLAAAHEKGVVHRDLKPENIFITSDGQVKVLDFGLAKLSGRSESGDERTLTHQTAVGTVLGTAAYMSPEQVRGQAIDHRSDIFSLGVVLYEMLSGTRAFAGESSVEVMNAILKTEPPQLQHASGSVTAVVEHCLQKDPAERFQSARDLAFALASLATPSQSLPTVTGSRWNLRTALPYAALGLLAIAFAGYAWRAQQAAPAAPRANKIAFERLTDLVGLETSPVISPDGKSVAFVSDTGGRRQIWVHLTAGGAPLQLTHDAGEHLDPRWSQDSASILYYSPPASGETQGALWEIAALGGVPRRLAGSLGEADVSHDGTQLAFFRVSNGRTELVVSDRDGSNARVTTSFANFSYHHPRWSPDDRSIAFEHPSAIWADDIYVVAAAGGEPRAVTAEGDLIEGLAWAPDGSAIIYSSSRGTTTLYLPLMHLWSQPIAGGPPRQLTFGEESYQGPDVGRDGRVVASRRHMHFDVWKFPVGGADAAANARHGIRITAQTGQVQTPTVAPDESALAFLWDSGTHGNIWVQDLRSGELRQVTHEHDPNVVLGVPTWSPKGDAIAFASTRHGGGAGISDVGYLTVRPDGSDMRTLIGRGAWASWSADGRWVYYSADLPSKGGARFDIFKVPAAGGEGQVVRTQGGLAPILSPDGSTLYYLVPQPAMNGVPDYEIRSAKPENGSSTVVLNIAGHRLPTWQGLVPEVSHNGKWLGLMLNDEYGTNLWLLSTADGKLHRAVDFSPRRTFIARRISWSPDDRFIYAALGEGDSDIVSMQGLLQ